MRCSDGVVFAADFVARIDADVAGVFFAAAAADLDAGTGADADGAGASSSFTSRRSFNTLSLPLLLRSRRRLRGLPISNSG